MIEGVLDSFDDLVTNLQVVPLDTLLLIDYFNYLFSSFKCRGSCLRFPAIEPEDHMGTSDLLILLDLFTKNALFIP